MRKLQKKENIIIQIGEKIKDFVEDVRGLFEPEPALVPIKAKDRRQQRIRTR